MCIKVYVAGPYSIGVIGENVETAILAGDHLANLGLIPFIPHLSHFWQLISQHDYKFWLAYDLKWLAECDCLLRLPGESKGADLEVKFAKEHGIPVFTSVDDLTDHFGVKEKGE